MLNEIPKFEFAYPESLTPHDEILVHLKASTRPSNYEAITTQRPEMNGTLVAGSHGFPAMKLATENSATCFGRSAEKVGEYKLSPKVAEL
ncbi:hypothetical protein AKJ16_DCAP23081 [Drosera capensis]